MIAVKTTIVPLWIPLHAIYPLKYSQHIKLFELYNDLGQNNYLVYECLYTQNRTCASLFCHNNLRVVFSPWFSAFNGTSCYRMTPWSVIWAIIKLQVLYVYGSNKMHSEQRRKRETKRSHELLKNLYEYGMSITINIWGEIVWGVGIAKSRV